MIDENFLIKIGFSKMGNPKTRKNKDGFLHWTRFFGPGDLIGIQLELNHGKWEILNIEIKGGESNNYISKMGVINNLEDAIKVVRDLGVSICF